ncbi:hypothetical protein ACJJTC_001288 [Scirpophaga incertulas]
MSRDFKYLATNSSGTSIELIIVGGLVADCSSPSEREEESSAAAVSAASSASAGAPQDVYAIDEPSAREACGAQGAGCARAADAPCPLTHDSDTSAITHEHFFINFQL